MAVIYSTQLLKEAGFTGDFTVTTPTGFVTVLRDIDAYANNPLPSVSPIHLRLKNSLGGTLWVVQVDPDTEAFFQWRGRQVFPAGDSFTISTDAAWDYSVSGYLLTAP